MSPEILRGFYRLAVFLSGASIVLLFLVPPDSAEFVVTIMSLGIGLTLLLLIILTSWFINR